MEDWVHNYVIESNAIENISKGEGSPEYDNHILITEHVAEESRRGNIIPAKEIHSGLMRGLLQGKYIGAYRDCDVWVGGNKGPDCRLLFKMMEDFERKVEDFISGEEEDRPKKIPLDSRCMNFHHYFECIHPFVDGNGRTGRLILNNLRLLQGMEWHTVESVWAMRERYYSHIQDWRRVFFNQELLH